MMQQIAKTNLSTNAKCVAFMVCLSSDDTGRLYCSPGFIEGKLLMSNKILKRSLGELSESGMIKRSVMELYDFIGLDPR